MAACHLPPAKLLRYAALRKNEDRLRMWETHRLLIETLDNQFNLKPANIHYIEQEGKKPFLREDTGIRFNLSHSGKMTAVACSGSETGIDIEEIIMFDDLRQSARVFMSDAEFKMFIQMNEKDGTGYFYRIWTLKESLLKNTGKGLSDDLQAYSFDLDGKAPVVSLNGRPLAGYHFFEIRHFPDYAASVCSCAPDPLIIL